MLITVDVGFLLLHFGLLSVSWYALAVISGFAVVVSITKREVRRKG